MKIKLAIITLLLVFAARALPAQQSDANLERARRILDQVRIIDGHNDLPS